MFRAWSWILIGQTSATILETSHICIPRFDAFRFETAASVLHVGPGVLPSVEASWDGIWIVFEVKTSLLFETTSAVVSIRVNTLHCIMLVYLPKLENQILLHKRVCVCVCVRFVCRCAMV